MFQHLRVLGPVSAASVGLAFVLTSLAVWVAAPAANATDLLQITACGQSVDTDAVLVKNLTCTGDGLIITGDGVTVDLGGHAIRSSTGTGRGVVIYGPEGSTTTIRGPGRVAGFLRGIDDQPHSDEDGSLLGSATLPSYLFHHTVVDGIRLVDNAWGIWTASNLTDVIGTTIRGENGIGHGGCSGCDFVGVVNVDSSSVTSTGTALGAAFPGSELHVTHSHLGGGLITFMISSSFTASDSSFKNIRIDCNESGMHIDRSRMVDTSVSCQSTGGGSFTDNVIRSTKGGTALTFGPMWSGGGSSIRGNRFSGWTDAIAAAPESGLEITDNQFEGNVTGVRTVGCSSHYELGNTGAIRDNRFVRNGGDAVVLECDQWAVGENNFLFNRGLGINASGPDVQVTDEGGNIARGNAEPQCVGVVCRSR